MTKLCTQCGKPLGEYSIIMPTIDKTRQERCEECVKADKDWKEFKTSGNGLLKINTRNPGK